MNLLRPSTLLTLLFTTVVTICPSQASDTELSVGLGAIYTQAPYKNWDGDEVTPFPYISFKKGNFYIEGADIGYTAISSEKPESGYYVDVIASLRAGVGYQVSDSTVFEGMTDKDDIATEVGFKAGIYGNYGLVELTNLYDVSDTHEGSVSKLSYLLPIENESKTVEFIPYAGLTLQSKKFNQYYYGVDAAFETPHRAAYSADKEVIAFIGATTIYHFNSHWSLIVDMEYQQLGSEIKDSPLVARDNTLSGLMSVNYHF